MTRAVLDANAIVSGIMGLAIAASSPGEVLRRWHRQDYGLVVSTPIMAEVRRAFQKPYFTERRSLQVIERNVDLIHRRALFAALTINVTGVATHPEDDLVLATAVSASVDILVSGDRQLLKLGSYEGVRILSPRDFLTYLDAQPTSPTPAPQP